MGSRLRALFIVTVAMTVAVMFRTAAVPAAPPIEVWLWLNKSNGEVYTAGERVIIYVKASTEGYLQLVYIDTEQSVFLIYPNRGTAKDGKIMGGKEIALGRGVDVDGFEFEVTSPYGAELVRAYYSSKPLPLPPGGTREGGMIAVGMSPDSLDVYYYDQAAKLGAQLTGATTVLRTAPSLAGLPGSDTRPPDDVRADIPKPKIYGLVIGVSRYASPRIKGLRYAEADARLMANYLASPRGAGIPSDRIRLLLNSEATRGNILDAFSKFLASSGRDDLVFIYLAGHGLTDQERSSTYFLSHDSDLGDLAATAVDQAEITTLLTGRVKAGKIVFFLDACHGGGLGLTGVRMRGANTVISARLLAEVVANKNGTAFLTASRAMEQSQEGERWGGGHGVFTWYLVEGLRKHGDLNGDLRVTIDELYDFVASKVKADTEGLQHPELKGYFDNGLVLSVLR